MTILFATDGSEPSEEALQLIQALPLPPGTRIHVVTVLIPIEAYLAPPVDAVLPAWTTFQGVWQAEREQAGRLLAATASRLERPGLEVTTELRHGQPAREILEAARERAADLTVVGSRGRTGLEAVLLGSVARNVAKHAKGPVLVARRPRGGLRRAIAATDGSPHARNAIRFAAGLPLPEGMEVTVLYVSQPYHPFPGLLPTDRREFEAAVLEVNRRRSEEGLALAEEAAAELAAAGKKAEALVREGNAADEILSLADEQRADLIIVGARGASLIEGLLVGSVADRILKEAPCSVLIVP